MSCDATDNVGIYVVEAYLEQPGDAAWQQVVLEPTEGASPYLGTLPGDSILPDRMDVVFGAKDLSKNTATSPPHGFEVPYTFTVIAE